MRVVVASPHALVSEDLEPYRRELTGYCYRMLGSSFDAEDAVQEAMVRAWRASGNFEGRSSARSWLYRIATNVCLDMLRGRQRRARPDGARALAAARSSRPCGRAARGLVGFAHRRRPGATNGGGPGRAGGARDSIRLAFVAALQHLPARQRAVLVLCEVLRWQAAEAAELLGTSVAAVNSALQRARATLATDRHRGLPGGAGR